MASDTIRRLRTAAESIQGGIAQTMLEAADLLERHEGDALVVELAAHDDCPKNLGVGGTVAWHRETIKRLQKA